MKLPVKFTFQYNRIIIAILATSLLTLSCTIGKTKRDRTISKSPNIIFLFVDNLGWRDINGFDSDPDSVPEYTNAGGQYDNRNHFTPNIAKLRDEGMRFTNAYSVCPFCKATRASLYTGKHPMRLRITAPGNGPHLPLAETTIAEALKEQNPDYICGFFGKWQVDGTSSYPTYEHINNPKFGPQYQAAGLRFDRPLPVFQRAPRKAC